MDVAAQRVNGDLTAQAARADDRHLALEGHPLLVQERHVTELGPGALGVRLATNDGLPLAVVAEAARLQHAGDTDDAERARELAARADRVPAGRRNPQASADSGGQTREW